MRAAVFSVVLALLIGTSMSCARKTSAPPNRLDLHVGDVVKIRIDGTKAMVTNVYYYTDPWDYQRGWFVNCRVSSAGQNRRDGLVSADTVITAYQTVEFRAYELERIEESK
jgi:hypothetical protein